MSTSVYSHDHVVLLLDTPDFENPPAWLADNFNIIEGGTHAGGSSRNKLIILADGTYIELINWITKPSEFFDWAGKPPGLLDFALTSAQASAHETYQAVLERLAASTEKTTSDAQGAADDSSEDLGISYKTPLAGGRKRKDGKEVSWFVTKPLFNLEARGVPSPAQSYFPNGRLDAPFFCHDVSDRDLRVPYQEGDVTKHPCGALGVLSVRVVVPQAKLDAYGKVYAAVTGVQPQKDPTTGSLRFGLGAVDSTPLKPIQSKVDIEVAPIANPADENWVKERGLGIREVRLWVPKSDGVTQTEEIPLDKSGIGASVILVKSQT
ncbi:hypothetical protein B0A52_05227 [Exophiala mesophila]|uniref:Glyoxalase-like domain-containing protein n=1 Tax=Exophiala mesophila TaxID=212818 RepID=A0A438N492_EXOME|nr:hypothetical protein B0A52_05227 [Exophiala mesophila]